MSSRYHLAKQNDGHGWMLLRLDALHTGFANARATVVDCNLPEERARQRLAECRAEETAQPAPGGPR